MGEVLPAAELTPLSVVEELDAPTFLAATDLVEPPRVGDRREKLVVLAEAEILEPGPRRERHPLELDDEPTAGAGRDVAGVDREPARDVEHRRGSGGELVTLLQPERRPDVALLAKGRTCSSERPGDHEPIARTGAAAAGNALRVTE